MWDNAGTEVGPVRKWGPWLGGMVAVALVALWLVHVALTWREQVRAVSSWFGSALLYDAGIVVLIAALLLLVSLPTALYRRWKTHRASR